MITLTYAALAIVFLMMVIAFLRKPSAGDSDDAFGDKSNAPSMGNGRWIDLSERIFDPGDARWLEEELAFPKLAAALKLSRKQLAICWLEALQTSFDDLIRTPDPTTASDPEAVSAGSWKMLWVTVRFKLLVTYALFVVKLFGPYHRLIPSFSWLAVPHERGFRSEALAQSRGSN
jgi:hypothetical protein